MSITVFLGYRYVMEHLVIHDSKATVEPYDYFTPEVQQWCDENLSGPARPIYEFFEKLVDGEMKRFGRYIFEFANERDATLFKLFHVRG